MNFAAIGLGSFGIKRARAIKESKLGKLSALYDSNPDILQKASKELQVPSKDYKKIMEDENIEVIVNAYSKIENKDVKIIFAHSYGSLVSVSAILREKIDPDYLILSAPHFDDNYPKFVKNMSGAMAKVFPKLRAPSPVNKRNLSTDKETVDNYFNDPLVFRSLTFKFGNEITVEQKFVNENIDKLKIPTLVLHGDKDKIVPIKASENISKLENVKFIIVENSKHEILNQDTRTFVLSEIHYWFKENNLI